MENKVLKYVKQKQLIQPQTKVLIATSGGPDSIALLHFLWKHQEVLEIEPWALSIDHGLRKETSKSDSLFVKKICEKWNIPFLLETVDVKGYQTNHQIGTQLAARHLRYDVYKKQLQRHQIHYLALGHHADDQLETTLLSLTRTTTLHNLVGIPPIRALAGAEIIRPFLCVGKQDIMQYLGKYQLKARLDESNLTNDYTRNRLRHEVVPKLKQENPNILTTVQKLTESLHHDDQFIMDAAKSAFSEVVQIGNKGRKASILIQPLLQYPAALQRRMFRLTLDYLYDIIPKQLSYKHEDIFFELLHDKGNKQLHFPSKLIVEKAYNFIHMYFQKETIMEGAKLVDSIPAKLSFKNGDELTFEYIDQKLEQSIVHTPDPYTYVCSKEELLFPLTIRHRKPGDRMTYTGLSGTKKIKDILIDEKIPRFERESYWLLEDASQEVFWLLGLKKNERINQEHQCLIRIHYNKNRHE